jgi:hypothetical protein
LNILAELIQAQGETLRYEIHAFINSVLNKEELPDQWKEYIVVPIYKKVQENLQLRVTVYVLL